MSVRKMSLFITMLLSVFLLCGRLAFAAQPSINILGDVVGSGTAEMKTAFNQWISVSGKTYPVIDGATFRSKDGNMSLIFRDSVRMEVGKNSEIVVSGSRGSYAVSMNSGQIIFSVPRGVSFSVKTPTSTVQTREASALIRKVSLSSQDDIKGVISYDGKGTKITAISGTLTVRSGMGVQLQSVAAGNAIYIEGKDSANIRTVQLAGGATGGAGAAPDRSDPTPLWVAGGGAGVVTGGYFLVNSLYEASPAD